MPTRSSWCPKTGVGGCVTSARTSRASAGLSSRRPRWQHPWPLHLRSKRRGSSCRSCRSCRNPCPIDEGSRDPSAGQASRRVKGRLSDAATKRADPGRKAEARSRPSALSASSRSAACARRRSAGSSTVSTRRCSTTTRPPTSIASVGKIIQVQKSYLQFPIAAANAVILLSVVLMMIWGLTRLVDIRCTGSPSCGKGWAWSTSPGRFGARWRSGWW